MPDHAPAHIPPGWADLPLDGAPVVVRFEFHQSDGGVVVQPGGVLCIRRVSVGRDAQGLCIRLHTAPHPFDKPAPAVAPAPAPAAAAPGRVWWRRRGH